MGPGRRKRFRSFKEVERFLGYTLPSKNPEHDRFNETSSEDEAERPKKKSKSVTTTAAKKKSSKSKKSKSSSEDSSSSEEEEEETEMERRKRKEIAYLRTFTKKNGPKNPPTAYILYMSAERPKVAKQYPHLKTTEILKHIGPMVSKYKTERERVQSRIWKSTVVVVIVCYLT